VGIGFGNSIYLDFHLAELQLFVTPHELETLSCVSRIPAPGFFFTGLSRRRVLTELAGESSSTGRTVDPPRCHANYPRRCDNRFAQPVTSIEHYHVTVSTIRYLGIDISLGSGFTYHNVLSHVCWVTRQITDLVTRFVALYQL
jgi:hypothetical protein